MTGLTRSDVDYVANLANLKLTERETRELRRDLSATLNFVEKLQEVNTRKTIPTSNVSGLKNIVRDDVPRPSLSQDQALKNAPVSHNCFFKTKSIF